MKGLNIIIAFIILIFSSCSTKNSSWVNKSFHQTTARFNGYFNANESIKEAVVEYKYGNPTDYSELVPTFFIPSENATSLYPAMDVAIEKASKVITNHSMDINEKQSIFHYTFAPF